MSPMGDEFLLVVVGLMVRFSYNFAIHHLHVNIYGDIYEFNTLNCIITGFFNQKLKDYECFRVDKSPKI